MSAVVIPIPIVIREDSPTWLLVAYAVIFGLLALFMLLVAFGMWLEHRDKKRKDK